MGLEKNALCTASVVSGSLYLGPPWAHHPVPCCLVAVRLVVCTISRSVRMAHDTSMRPY